MAGALALRYTFRVGPKDTPPDVIRLPETRCLECGHTLNAVGTLDGTRALALRYTFRVGPKDTPPDVIRLPETRCLECGHTLNAVGTLDGTRPAPRPTVKPSLAALLREADIERRAFDLKAKP